MISHIAIEVAAAAMTLLGRVCLLSLEFCQPLV